MMNEFETRLKVLGALVVFIIVLLVARAGYLQVYQGEVPMMEVKIIYMLVVMVIIPIK